MRDPATPEATSTPDATPTSPAAPEQDAALAPSQGDDDDDWTPPPGAVKFGPFLAIGALAELFMGPLLRLLGP
jgi:hypothetical protein